MARRILLHHILVMILAPLFFAQTGQPPRSAAVGSVYSQQRLAQDQGSVANQEQVMALPAMMAALPYLPTVQPPLFQEPANDYNNRFQALMGEYMTSLAKKGEPVTPLRLYQGLAKSLQNRAGEMAAQYGSHDSRAITPLEDAAFVLFTIHEVEAGSRLLDQALFLRESEGTQSIAYWKDLKLRCTIEAQQSTVLQLPDCDQALQVRSKQTGTTPLELASWLRTLGLSSSYMNRQRSMEYQERSLNYYSKVPGVSPAFMASEYRRLAIFAFSQGKSEQAFHLNDLTNQYLSLGDASVQKTIVTNAALKAAADTPLVTMNPESRIPPKLPNLTPQMQKQIEEAQRNFHEQFEQFKTKSEERPQDKMLNQYNFFNQLYSRSRGDNAQKPLPGEPQSPATFMFCPSDQMLKLWEAMISPYKRIESIRERLDGLSNMGFYFASTWEACSNNVIPVGGTGSPADAFWPSASFPVPGYSVMVRVKGAFSESIAPRKSTVMPGQSENHEQVARITQAAMTAEDKSKRAVAFSIMTPQEKEALNRLSKDAQDKLLQDRWNQLKKEDPNGAEQRKNEINEQVLQTPEGQKIARDMLAVMGMGDPSQFKPLVFLEMLKPHEAFIDIYEYQIKEENRFGAEHYLAVVSQSPTSSKKIQLGSATTIDGTVDSFYDALNSGAPLAPVWKDLKERIVQPILAAVPPGTERIWLSPDSKLISVPFASLLLDMGSQIQVSIIPSPYDFVRIRSAKPVSPGKVLFVGGLSYGNTSKRFESFASIGQPEREIDALSQEASSAQLQVETLSGSTVMRPLVIGHLHQVRFLHFSTHGFLENPVIPDPANEVLLGGVALSQANSENPDSFLTAEDIRHIDLSDVELVTLSACDTARSNKRNVIEGQGLLGFQTAFMAAGTRSLLFSLWKAPLDKDKEDNDATSLFMDTFYDGVWAKKLNKAEAMRQAQIAVRSNPRFANPRFWATWVLVGEAW
jgi:CHAT domain-containing protein